jgi:NADPH:quinone reductase-like Zn-dependent oxidoreductase
VAGTVTETGAKVADLRTGDEVFGWCGRAVDGGGFAEYARCPRNRIVRKPATIAFEQARLRAHQRGHGPPGRPGLG